tara:strand:+ start:514 stop:954 length:441 start_codon:yes stop_codon:yes gene_type:complete
MNINNIFSLFGSNDKDDKEDLDAFKDSPLFKVGMFKKMIWNGKVFRDQVLNFLKKADIDMEIGDDLDEAGDYMMHTRAYYWVQDCNLQDEEWKKALNHYIDDEFVVCFKLCIKYFEEFEEFEKCAFLKKIQTYIEKQEVLNKLKET